MTQSNRDEILRQAEVMGLALSADGTSWIPATKSTSVDSEGPTAKENAAVKEDSAPTFGTGIMHILALYVVLSLLSYVNQKSNFDFNPCVSYGSSCGSDSSMGFYEYVTIVPLVLAGLIFIWGLFLLVTDWYFEKKGTYGGGVMVGAVLSVVLFLVMTFAGSFGLGIFFE